MTYSELNEFVDLCFRYFEFVGIESSCARLDGTTGGRDVMKHTMFDLFWREGWSEDVGKLVEEFVARVVHFIYERDGSRFSLVANVAGSTSKLSRSIRVPSRWLGAR